MTASKFRDLANVVSNLQSQIPQTDLQLAQLLLRAEDFTTKSQVRNMFENNNSGVRAVTELMNLQSQEI